MGAGSVQSLIAEPKGETQREKKKHDEKARSAGALELDFPWARHEETRPGEREVFRVKQTRA